MAPMAMRVTEMGASEGCPVIGQIAVASPLGDKITSPETELTSCWFSSSRTVEEPIHEKKHMTMAQAIGPASLTTMIPQPCESSASKYRVGVILLAARSDLA